MPDPPFFFIPTKIMVVSDPGVQKNVDPEPQPQLLNFITQIARRRLGSNSLCVKETFQI